MPDPTAPARPGRYHHGDLRQALIDEALAMIGESGLEALTIRALARRVGVSHAAPAHHFASKADLIGVLAAEGFRRLADAMERAAAEVDTPVERLLAIGQGYLRFARDNPSHFRVIFQHDADTSDAIKLADAESRAYNVLRETCAEALASRGRPPGEPELQALTATAWGLVHGLATLWLDGPMRCTPDGTSIDLELLGSVSGGLFGQMLEAHLAHGKPLPDPGQDSLRR